MTSWLGALAMLVTLTGCFALDQEEEVRARLADWLFLAQTKHFTSKPSCTVGIFHLAVPDVRTTGGPRRVTSFPEARQVINQGRAVVFDMPGVTPDAVSQGIMSLDLSAGLGLMSSAIGPTLDCMEEDHIQRGFYAVLTSDEAITIYDPQTNVLVMVYRPEALAVYMRGNV